MPQVVRSATTSWTGTLAEGEGYLATGSGAITSLPLTFPRRMGEPEGFTSPEELLASTHASCFAMSLASALAAAAASFVELVVTVDVTLNRVDGTLAVTSSDVQVAVDSESIDQAALDELLETADKRCPMSQLIRHGARVTISGVVEG
ncbi:OsmC family peroxiredoxin [Microbacterium sp. MPKO10]|nr:OsmC family peroxiredoxin [Microbacterium sp. MPKO10]